MSTTVGHGEALLLPPGLCSVLPFVKERTPTLVCLNSLPQTYQLRQVCLFRVSVSLLWFFSGQYQFDFYCSLRKPRWTSKANQTGGEFMETIHCVMFLIRSTSRCNRVQQRHKSEPPKRPLKEIRFNRHRDALQGCCITLHAFFI